MQLRNLLIASLGLAMAAGAAGAASAATPWQAHHPRRVEVNHRIEHLNRSIRVERREGRISGAEAYRLHARVHMIRHRERVLARRDGGHISRIEQARLNHKEAGVRSHLPA
jgi:hypothetical protein